MVCWCCDGGASRRCAYVWTTVNGWRGGLSLSLSVHRPHRCWWPHVRQRHQGWLASTSSIVDSLAVSRSLLHPSILKRPDRRHHGRSRSRRAVADHPAVQRRLVAIALGQMPAIANAMACSDTHLESIEQGIDASAPGLGLEAPTANGLAATRRTPSNARSAPCMTTHAALIHNTLSTTTITHALPLCFLSPPSPAPLHTTTTIASPRLPPWPTATTRDPVRQHNNNCAMSLNEADTCTNELRGMECALT